MTMMSSRKELFHTISEMCDEMRKKLDTDFDNTFVRSWGVGWQVVPPERSDDEDEKDPRMGRTRPKHSDDDDPEDRFSCRAVAGFIIGVEHLRIETSYEKYKYIDIFHLHSVVEGKYTNLRTNIKWYDRLRPTYWKMQNLIKYSRRLRVKHQSIDMEKDLAKMIPDRIDNILLGGTNGKN